MSPPRQANLLKNITPILGAASRIVLGRPFGTTFFFGRPPPATGTSPPHLRVGWARAGCGRGARKKRLYRKTYLGQRETLFSPGWLGLGENGGDLGDGVVSAHTPPPDQQIFLGIVKLMEVMSTIRKIV